MKSTLLLALTIGLASTYAGAQVINDTVTTGAGYANNVWYSLASDDQATDAATTWDLGFSTQMGAMDPLTTAIIFNHKIGTLYEIPGSDPTDFEGADSAGLSTWTPLYNSETSWALGGFNNTEDLGQFDYGWGTYNMTTHGIDANRVFIIKYTAGGCKKLMISSANTLGTYSLTFANLDNTGSSTVTIDVATFAAKNFVYYNLGSETIVDREPATTSWDLYFHQYPSFDYDPPYTVAGIFHNVGVQVAQAYPVNDPATYVDWAAQTFSEEINTIGYDWKSFGMGWTIADSTVYFVADKAGDIWKVIFTGFGGSANGKYMFSKEKVSEAGIEENGLFAAIYPNPSNDCATVMLNNAPNAEIMVFDLAGKLVASQKADAAALTAVTVSTADLSNGAYQLVVVSGNAASTQKLIVQH
jgi:hypothetical protein